MPRSLASALKDFGTRSAPPSRFEAPAHATLGLDTLAFDPPALDIDVDSGPDVDALIADAVAAAEAALAARLAEEHEEASRIERERHEEELAALHRQLAEHAAIRIEAAVDEAERHVVALTSAVAARILGAVLTDDLRDRSLARLAETIRDALADHDALRIRVRGSLPLYEALKSRLERHEGQLDFSESPAFDLSVTIDDSVYETRLAEWSAALAEALS